MNVTKLGIVMFGLVMSASVGASGGCNGTIVNEQHCWMADGDETCATLFGGGFCSTDDLDCEGHGVPYGCVFTRPMSDSCYSPTGHQGSCADDPNSSAKCDEEEVADAGESETSDSDGAIEDVECGDDVPEGDEQCDDGNTVDDDGCTNSCTLPICGDGIVQASMEEDCDDGNGIGDDDCTDACTLPICGDGIVQASMEEDCDDGNTLSGDACTASCLVAGDVTWDGHYDIDNGKPDVGYEVELDGDDHIDILATRDEKHHILEFDAEGKKRWSKKALAGGDTMQEPNLTIGTDGQVVIGFANPDSLGMIRQFDSEGSDDWSHEVASSTTQIAALDTDAFGHVVAAGFNLQGSFLIRLRSSDGSELGIYGDADDAYSQLVLGADGQVRVWGNERIESYDLGGASLWESDKATDVSDCRAMALDDDNNAYVLSQDGDEKSYTLLKFDSVGKEIWAEKHDESNVDEGADGLVVLPNGGALVAGYTGSTDDSTRRGTLSWFSPDGELVWDLVIEDDDLKNARLYDVAISPEDYAVAVGSWQLKGEESDLWIRKFAI